MKDKHIFPLAFITAVTLSLGATAADVSSLSEFEAVWSDTYDGMINPENDLELWIDINNDFNCTIDKHISGDTSSSVTLSLATDTYKGLNSMFPSNVTLENLTLSNQSAGITMFQAGNDVTLNNINVTDATGSIVSADGNIYVYGTLHLNAEKMSSHTLFSTGIGTEFTSDFTGLNIIGTVEKGAEYILFDSVTQGTLQNLKDDNKLYLEDGRLIERYHQPNDSYQLVLVAIPEPASAFLLTVTVIPALLRRRR